VVKWDPPNRIVLAWQIDGTWHFDPNLVTELEVTFVPEGPGVPRVELEHRNLDRLRQASWPVGGGRAEVWYATKGTGRSQPGSLIACFTARMR
jgi:uncharacterized protein YndB with AHSA1/START domain